jgi:hypothetical protein
MSGHGWVIPNKDGTFARCGGPAICSACALEEKQLSMNNQHTQILGYRDLSLAEIELINEIKGMGERVGALVNKLATLGMEGGAEGVRVTDHRWICIGRTHLQEGFMCLVRAVAKPTTF